MTFEIVNYEDSVVMYTYDYSCIPDVSILELMSEAGFTFKLDNKKNNFKKFKKVFKGDE